MKGTSRKSKAMCWTWTIWSGAAKDQTLIQCWLLTPCLGRSPLCHTAEPWGASAGSEEPSWMWLALSSGTAAQNHPFCNAKFASFQDSCCKWWALIHLIPDPHPGVIWKSAESHRWQLCKRPVALCQCWWPSSWECSLALYLHSPMWWPGYREEQDLKTTPSHEQYNLERQKILKFQFSPALSIILRIYFLHISRNNT